MWNSKTNVYQTEWLDLVFANRNKAYGAYELRQHNGRTTIKALISASVLMVGIILLLFSYSTTPAFPPESMRDQELIIHLGNLTKQRLPLQVPKREKSDFKVKTQKFVAPNIVPESQINEEPVSMTELQHSVIGPATENGPSASDLQQTGPGDDGAGASNNVTPLSDDVVVSVDLLERYPEFPGGQTAFAKYLGKNLKYPYQAVENNITGRVLVSFIIERNGDLSEVKVLRGIGGGCDEEAVRVLKNSPAWSPGIQNGRPMRVAYTVPIHFQLGR